MGATLKQIAILAAAIYLGTMAYKVTSSIANTPYLPA